MGMPGVAAQRAVVPAHCAGLFGPRIRGSGLTVCWSGTHEKQAPNSRGLLFFSAPLAGPLERWRALVVSLPAVIRHATRSANNLKPDLFKGRQSWTTSYRAWSAPADLSCQPASVGRVHASCFSSASPTSLPVRWFQHAPRRAALRGPIDSFELGLSAHPVAFSSLRWSGPFGSRKWGRWSACLCENFRDDGKDKTKE